MSSIFIYLCCIQFHFQVQVPIPIQMCDELLKSKFEFESKLFAQIHGINKDHVQNL
jgi:hypothetical protein